MKSPLIAALLLLAACTSTAKGGADVVPYDLDTCIVMDSKLGSMGDPIVRVYDGQEIKFCCKPCVAEFEADPAFYMERLAEARAER